MTKPHLAICLLLAASGFGGTASRPQQPQPQPTSQQRPAQPATSQQQPSTSQQQQQQPATSPRTAAQGSAAGRFVTLGRLRLESCGGGERPEGALCGRHEVFENRETRRGRKISLNLLVLPSLAQPRAPDPVFYFMGGPGGAATMAADGSLINLFRRRRDVVFVDQRGTGGSHPLRCEMFGEMASYFVGDAFPAARVRACRAELEKIADLRHYTTPAAMADIDEVRDALGYERINVSGGSYGSTAALAYLHLYPRRVRAAAVAGVAPVDFKMALPWARGVEQTLERLFADCAADEACRAAFPALRREFAELHERLGRAPATFEAVDPKTGARRQITLTRDGLMEHVRAMLYQPSLQSTLPLLIHDMHGGSYARFALAAYEYFSRLEGIVARGMHLSVVCAESAPFTTDEEIRRETAGTFYGDARLRSYQRACELWPRGALPARYRDPAKTDVPVLMVSGALDPVTPPSAAAAALPQYTRGRHVVIPNAAHGLDECTVRLLAEFVERGAADNLDASCAAQVRRRPFATQFPPNR